ncbi:MAG TPA: TonB-dependent receptor [Bacteroidales bacterium]|nr:TonB-dependent receptor [Bacteroidales bacterium]
MKQKSILLLWFSLLAIGILQAQDLKLTGTILDIDTKEPLPGATVMQKGTTNATVTDENGVFNISAPAGSILAFSYLGYVGMEMTVKNENVLKIQLRPNSKMLDNVVVVGYGTQKVKDMTAPVTSVKGSDLVKQISANPMSALQGKMSGVQIINSGAPGAGPTVKIRGVGSIGDYAGPLYVVDGVFVNNIDFLSSGDIEDLTVLKDASAAAIYGVRAANGVILVTTKKGKTNAHTVSYDGYAGLQVPTNVMKLANTKQYVELMNEANVDIPGYVTKSVSNYPASTDWYSELLRTAFMHNHALDISGGTDKTNYSVGINYFYQEGIMKAENDYKRLNLRARLDQKVNDRINIGFNTILTNSNKHHSNDNAFFQAFVNPPIYGVYDETNTAAYPVHFGSGQLYGLGNQYGNPVASAYYNHSQEAGMKLVFSTFAEYSIIPDKLKFKTSYNLDFAFWRQQTYEPEFNVGGSQGLLKSTLSKTFGTSSKHIIDNLLTFADKADELSYNLMLGQSTRIETQSWLNGSALSVPDFDAQSIYLTTGSSQNRYANDGAYTYHGLSFFTRGTFNLKDKYLASVTLRADGSSKFQDKWGIFPSLGLGWNISSEDFMSDSKFEYLKLRASWGMLGNDGVPANSAVTLGSSGAGSSAIFGDRLVDGVGSQTVYQNYLKWEIVNEVNIGADFEMMDHKLKGELDLYDRVTSNVVFYAPIVAGGGTTQLLGNNGTVQNMGIELGLNWTDKLSDDLSYNIGMNATTIHNKVLKLQGRNDIPGAAVRGNYTTKTQVGYPIGTFWGYQIDGVYASEAEALRDPTSQTIKDAGYFKYRDQNGDKVIDDKDKVSLGSAIPWLSLGIDAGLNYGKWDLSATIQGQFGNKILNAKRMNRDVFADANYDLDFYQNAWRSSAKSDKYPSARAYTSSFTQQANSFFVEDASYIRIQNIQIGYNFDNLKFAKNLRVYFAAQRPLSLFSYNGFTPEVGGSPIENGIDYSTYPMQAIYTLGLKLTL